MRCYLSVGITFKDTRPHLRSWNPIPVLSSKFIALALMFRSLVHFCISVCLWYEVDFAFLGSVQFSVVQSLTTTVLSSLRWLTLVGSGFSVSVKVFFSGALALICSLHMLFLPLPRTSSLTGALWYSAACFVLRLSFDVVQAGLTLLQSCCFTILRARFAGLCRLPAMFFFKDCFGCNTFLVFIWILESTCQFVQ